MFVNNLNISLVKPFQALWNYC